MRRIVDQGKISVEEAEAMIGGSLTPKRMGFWQTPTTEDAGRTGSAEDMRKYVEDGQTSGCRLRNQVQMWPTPTGQDNPQVVGQYPDHPKRGTALGGAVRQRPTPVQNDTGMRKKKYARGGTPLSMAVGMWPTPQSHDGTGGPPGAGTVARGGRQKDLQTAVAMFPTPQANEDAAGSPNGRMQRMLGNCKEVRGDDPSEWISGVLNPTWTEWLMGWPLCWTSTEPLPAESWAAWQRAFLRESRGSGV